MAPTAASVRMAESLRALLAGITDQQTRDLTAAWAAAWDEVAPELSAAVTELLAAAKAGRVTRSQALRAVRLRAALATITDRIEVLAGQTGTRIVGDLRSVVNETGLTQVSMLLEQLPPDARDMVTAWSRVDPEQVAAIVTRTTTRIEAATRPLAADAVKVMRRELVRGVAVGANPNETARRIMVRAQGGFDGGLARAVRIARTETLDAHRAAARLSDLANPDTVTGWRWVASLSPRTCPACWSLNGTLHAPTDPGPLGHQQCRCTRAPETVSWADLGFDIPEPASVVPDTQTVFDSLGQAEQETILGKGGAAAYREGRWPMDQWATRRTTDGWRDSYVAARPPAAPGSSARLAS